MGHCYVEVTFTVTSCCCAVAFFCILAAAHRARDTPLGHACGGGEGFNTGTGFFSMPLEFLARVPMALLQTTCLTTCLAACGDCSLCKNLGVSPCDSIADPCVAKLCGNEKEAHAEGFLSRFLVSSWWENDKVYPAAKRAAQRGGVKRDAS